MQPNRKTRAVSEVRINHGGLVFRLFGERHEAIHIANLFTKQESRQYNAKAVCGEGGFLVVSADNKLMYDKAGLLPDNAMMMLKNKGAFLEWGDATQGLPCR